MHGDLHHGQVPSINQSITIINNTSDIVHALLPIEQPHSRANDLRAARGKARLGGRNWSSAPRGSLRSRGNTSTG